MDAPFLPVVAWLRRAGKHGRKKFVAAILLRKMPRNRPQSDLERPGKICK
jgi:hypothetical protein